MTDAEKKIKDTIDKYYSKTELSDAEKIEKIKNIVDQYYKDAPWALFLIIDILRDRKRKDDVETD